MCQLAKLVDPSVDPLRERPASAIIWVPYPVENIDQLQVQQQRDHGPPTEAPAGEPETPAGGESRTYGDGNTQHADQLEEYDPSRHPAAHLERLKSPVMQDVDEVGNGQQLEGKRVDEHRAEDRHAQQRHDVFHPGGHTDYLTAGGAQPQIRGRSPGGVGTDRVASNRGLRHTGDLDIVWRRYPNVQLVMKSTATAAATPPSGLSLLERTLETWRALVEPRRLIPIAAVGVPLVLAQSELSDSPWGWPFILTVVVVMIMAAPVAYRTLLLPTAARSPTVIRFVVYVALGGLAPFVLHTLPLLIGLPPFVSNGWTLGSRPGSFGGRATGSVAISSWKPGGYLRTVARSPCKPRPNTLSCRPFAPSSTLTFSLIH